MQKNINTLFKKMNISQMMLIVNNLLKKLKEASKTEVC